MSDLLWGAGLVVGGVGGDLSPRPSDPRAQGHLISRTLFRPLPLKAEGSCLWVWGLSTKGAWQRLFASGDTHGCVLLRLPL